jgi:prepilin-type processing-associated H-X9-DG protein/prepilin-type N-terminal cleavage/methylation domain-containing protein
MTTTPGRCRAFTLVETLVVITILGLILAITAVAVQGSREAARRAICAKNLNQFGVALSSYASTKNSYPKDGYRSSYSFLVELLPQLDQPSLFNAINFAVDAYEQRDPGNAAVRQATVSIFLCPTDREPQAGPVGWTSYAGNRGTGVQKYGYNGAFVQESRNSDMGIFTDGTSSTAAMSEWNSGPNSRAVRDRKRIVFETTVLLTREGEFERFRQLCHGLDINRATPSVRIKGLDWLIAEFGNTLYNHTMPVNDLSCLNKTAIQQGAWTAGSQHPGGGANVLFVDGHVKWIREGISPGVWQALGSRDGGGRVGEADY